MKILLCFGSSHVDVWEDATHIPRVGDYVDHNNIRWLVTQVNWQDARSVSVLTEYVVNL